MFTSNAKKKKRKRKNYLPMNWINIYFLCIWNGEKSTTQIEFVVCTRIYTRAASLVWIECMAPLFCVDADCANQTLYTLIVEDLPSSTWDKTTQKLLLFANDDNIFSFNILLMVTVLWQSFFCLFNNFLFYFLCVCVFVYASILSFFWSKKFCGKNKLCGQLYLVAFFAFCLSPFDLILKHLRDCFFCVCVKHKNQQKFQKQALKFICIC